MADHNGTGAKSDYDRIGGGPAVRAVVDRFYELVLADADLAPFFVGVDLSGLRRHQALLISQVLGGPAEYSGRELHAAHADLPITAEHFGAVVAHLMTALTEAGVPAEVIARVGEALGAAEKDIVTQPVG
jgi:hemoglobin